jgi:hypothetical protein
MVRWESPSKRGRTVIDAAALFGRHLDLRRLGSRTRGTVPCIFHSEKTASLSVDIQKGVFNCFGCGAQGGVKRFAELVGERQPDSPRARSSSSSSESDLQRARRRVMQDELHRQKKVAEWTPYLRAMNSLRSMERLVTTVRADADADQAGVWEALADAAVLETHILNQSAEVEGVLACGRVA